MIEFSTDSLRPEHRFDHWREVRARQLFGVTIKLDPQRRPLFKGEFRAVSIGDAVVSEMSASSYVLRRTGADIARRSSDSLYIGLQVKGFGRLDTGKGRQHLVGHGGLVIAHSDLPYTATPGVYDGFLARMIQIPINDDLTLGRNAMEIVAAPPSAAEALERPFRALLHAITASPAVPSQLETDDVTHLARLALALRGRLPTGMPEVRAASRSATRHLACYFMQRSLQRPELSPATVASSLGISLRQLHIVFESKGVSFSRTLTSMRVAEARRRLAKDRDRTVTDIGYACGFDSLATFYRAFTRLEGMPPGEYRQQCRIERSVAALCAE